MTEEEIYAALADHLIAMPDRPPIILPNEGDTGQRPRLEVAHFPVDPERIGINTAHRQTGLFQVTVVTDSDMGRSLAGNLTASVSTRFPADLITGGVHVTSRAFIAQAIPDGAEYRVPVTIRYEVLQ